MTAFSRLLCLIVCCVCAVSAHADSRSTQQRIEGLQGDIRQLEAALKKQQIKKQSMAKLLHGVEADISHVVRELRRIKEKIRSEKTHLSQFRQQKSVLDEELTGLKTAVKGYLVAAYLSKNSVIKQLLGDQRLSDLDRHMFYRNHLHAAQSQQIERLLTAMQALKSIERGIVKNIETIKAAEQRYTINEKELKGSHRQRQKLLALTARKIIGTKEELKALKAQESQLKRLLGKLSSSLEQSNMDASLHFTGKIISDKGRLIWPVSGKIKTRFGKQRLGSMRWNGMIVNASTGSEVKAVYAGKIVFSDWLRGYGLLIIIDHGNGVMSLYGYNESIDRFAGEYVRSGENIARSGADDGNEAGSYFEIRVNGKPVNPLHWLRRSNRG